MQKIIIKHIKGSKANQTEAFELPITELSLGRNATADIRFDPDRDDIVGRTHAKIIPTPDIPFGYILTDLNSRNGSFINGNRVLGSSPINPGDVIKLGETGPELVFDIDPRPELQPKPTRFDQAPPLTRESQTPTATSSITTSIPNSASTPGSIGRNTVERLISETRSDTRKKIINTVSVIVALILMVAGYLLYKSDKSHDELVSAFTKKEQVTNEEIQTLQDKIENTSQKGMTPSQIAEEYSQSTVYIEASWKLIYIPTGGQLYQKVECSSRNKRGKCLDKILPWYISIGDTVEPWLMTADKGPDGAYLSIGNSGQGSGFVVTEDGFILTNRHVASSWETRYSGLSLPGYLVVCPDLACAKPKVKLLENNESNSQLIASLSAWVPSQTKTLGGKPMKGKRLEGRNDYLDVTFPNTRTRIPAHVVRISDIADVAMIKIDIPQKQRPVVLGGDDILGGDDNVQPGDAITVTGYPAVSPDVAVKISSQDPMNRSEEWRVIPKPTVSASTISKIINGQAKIVGDTTSGYFSEMGDVYQLNLNTTGAGNSGGPVFNDQGRVIGLFTYGNRDASGIQNSFAVPIKYGQEIMGVQTIMK